MWEDDEITGRIGIQLQHLFAQELLSDQKDRFYTHAFSVMHKLSALKYHLKNYERIESAQYQLARVLFEKYPHKTREAFELIFEAEAFLFQVKSALDMLVKLVDPVIGDHRVKTHTFANDGDDLIKGLRQYTKQNGVNVNGVEDLIKVIELHQEGWIRKAIELRDEFNHVKGLNDYMFLPKKLPSGEVIPVKPTLKGIGTLKFFKVIYSNSAVFHQDFMVYSLALKAPAALFLAPEDEQRAIEQWKHFGKYVKFCWGMSVETE